MRVLAISSAYGGAACAVLDNGRIVAEGRITEERGLAGALPALVADLLSRAEDKLDLVAAIVGPGSFTGLRAGLSVAAGIGLAIGVRVAGVTVAEALAESLLAQEGMHAGRALWTAIAARRGQIFLDRGDGPESMPIGRLPAPGGRIAVCGNAANDVAAALAAAGADVMLTAARIAMPAHVAAVAIRRDSGILPWLDAAALYVEAPQARLSAAGLRAAPI
jgi:tRNA threonylcarbamoyladenosine biosynthesis protein TsaB